MSPYFQKSVVNFRQWQQYKQKKRASGKVTARSASAEMSLYGSGTRYTSVVFHQIGTPTSRHIRPILSAAYDCTAFPITKHSLDFNDKK